MKDPAHASNGGTTAPTPPTAAAWERSGVHERPNVSAASPCAAPERLDVIEATGRDLIGFWQNVLVLALREPLTVRRIDSLAVLQSYAAARFPRGYATLVLLPKLEGVLPGLRETGLREASRRLIESAPDEVLGVAEVIEGTGFVAASARSVATGLVLAARPRWSMRVFPSVEPAAQWITQWVDREERAAAPRRIVEALRHTLA
jgi:hypothetical protein